MGDGVEEEEEGGDGDGDDQYSDDGGMNACRVSCMQPADMDGCLHVHTHNDVFPTCRCFRSVMVNVSFGLVVTGKSFMQQNLY